MSVSVEHSTVYHYDDAVMLDPHTFRLRPRMTSTQWLLSFDLQILPAPARTFESLDQDGNLALLAWFDTPTRSLRVQSRFTVELRRQNPFDFVLSTQALHLPLVYPELLNTALAPYCHERDVSVDVRQFAQGIAAGVNYDTMSYLAALNQRLFQSCRHTIRPDGPPWPSQQTLLLREGACRDLAVLFCDACRVMGIAARFVSGYDCAVDRQVDSHMHAWTEVHLPDVGWRGFDPSRGLAVTNAHVPVAAAFDYELAAPIAGQFWGRGSRMETSLHIQLEQDSKT